jgi:hypothetical protein
MPVKGDDAMSIFMAPVALIATAPTLTASHLEA